MSSRVPLTRRLPAHRVFTSTRAQVQSLTLHLPEPPSANTYYRNVGGKTLISKAGRQYKKTVALLYATEFRTVQVAFPAPILVGVTLLWTRGIKSGDLDNRLKPTLDALKGLAFTDDKQVTEIHAFRRDAKNQPGIQVTVSRAPLPREG